MQRIDEEKKTGACKTQVPLAAPAGEE